MRRWAGLIPSGIGWLDAEIGGLPSPGVVVVLGDAGAGKSTLALGYTVSALARGRALFVTSDAPAGVLETANSTFEADLLPHLASRNLSILSFGMFFVNKMRSLQSVERPLAELGELIAEREFDHVIFDTIDPVLAWVEPTDAKVAAASVMDQLRSWGRSVMCTARSVGVPAAVELARLADGDLEIGRDRFLVHRAKWCNVEGLQTPIRLVQGRGFAPVETPPPPSIRPRTLLPAPPAEVVMPLLKLVDSGAREGRPGPDPSALPGTLPPPSLRSDRRERRLALVAGAARQEEAEDERTSDDDVRGRLREP